MRTLDRKIVCDLYLAFEATLVLAIGMVLAQVYVKGHLGVANYEPQYVFPVVVFPALAVLFLRNKGLYEFARLLKFYASIGDVLFSLIQAFACLVLIGFALGVANDYSRVWVVGWFGSSVVSVLLLRAIASRLFSYLVDSGHILRTTAIYGTPARAEALAVQLANAGTGVGIVGLFGPREPYPGAEPADFASGVSELITFGQSAPVDAVLVAAGSESADVVDELISALSVLPVEVQLHMAFGKGPMQIHGLSHLDGIPVLDVQRSPISKWGLLAKRVEDYVIASVAIVALAPLAAIIALAIRLDSPGPVLFSQKRHGFNNKVFRIWKFRTMHVVEEGDTCLQAVRNDPRTTRVGSFLRRTSLDELPQLLNVLAGDMSIVGPRPHPLNLNSHFDGIVERYGNRHKVRPGITGLAQIYGYRGPTAHTVFMLKRVEYDLQYIENWSIWLDIKIIAATPFLGIVNKNAF